MQIAPNYNITVHNNIASFEGNFPTTIDDKLKSLVLAKFREDTRLNHAEIVNPSITRMVLSRRAFDDMVILVGTVCIGSGNYIDYTVCGINIDIKLTIDD